MSQIDRTVVDLHRQGYTASAIADVVGRTRSRVSQIIKKFGLRKGLKSNDNAIEHNAPTSLYRHFSESRILLYVGITSSATARAAQHCRNAGWWTRVAYSTYEHYPDRRSAVIAERIAIETELPQFNKAFTPRSRQWLNNGRTQQIKDRIDTDGDTPQASLPL